MPTDHRDALTSPLRAAGMADESQILAFIREYYAYDEIPFRPDEMRRGLARLLSDPTLGRVFIIAQGRQDIGYVILTFGFDLEFGGKLGV